MAAAMVPVIAKEETFCCAVGRWLFHLESKGCYAVDANGRCHIPTTLMRPNNVYACARDGRFHSHVEMEEPRPGKRRLPMALGDDDAGGAPAVAPPTFALAVDEPRAKKSRGEEEK